MKDEKRIGFVDLIKGICIILVVMAHIGGSFERMDSQNMIVSFRMPLYFFISGIFFKSYGGFAGFLIRKINKLIIPFVFFYVGAFMVKYLIWKVAPGVFQLPVQWSDLLVVFNKHELMTFNPPIWFLIALFNCNILFYFVHALRKNHLPLMIIASLLIGVAGFILGKERIELPLYIDTAMSALPFYVGGFWIRRYTFFFQPHRFDKLIPVFIAAAIGILYCTAGEIGMRTNNFFEVSIFGFYTSAFAGILGIMLLGKQFKKIPVISYLGRYSVVTLGIHSFILFLANKCFGELMHGEWLSDIALLMIVLGISLACTPIIVKTMPQLVAQKEFFSLDNRIGHQKAKAKKKE